MAKLGFVSALASRAHGRVNTKIKANNKISFTLPRLYPNFKIVFVISLPIEMSLGPLGIWRSLLNADLLGIL